MKPRFLAVAAQPHAWFSLRSVVRDRRLSNPNNLWCTGDGKAQFYLDFVEAEDSTGFHAPQEAARIL